MENDADILIELGFEPLSTWQHAGENLTYDYTSLIPGMKPKLDERNALYAFIQNNEVKYIGRTARSIKKRFVGYCNPGQTRATNYRCHTFIKAGLGKQAATDILIFAPPSKLQYGGYQIDLAAGLEETLIVNFNPPWNGGKTRKITEQADIETELEPLSEGGNDPASQSTPVAEVSPPQEAETGHFEIRLGQIYYSHGYINPGVDASPMLGGHGEAIRIDLGDPTQYVISAINRTANLNGSVRIVGRNRIIANWFQEYFNVGDVVQATILGPNRILLHTPDQVQENRAG